MLAIGRRRGTPNATMGRMRLLHAADVHLDASYAGFGRLGKERADEVVAAFSRLPERAAEARADAVLIAGDLFDGPNTRPSTLAAVRDTLRRFIDLCVPVFLVPGNHDALTLKLNPYREIARGGRVVMQNGDHTAGRPWPLRDEQGRQLADKHRVYLLANPAMSGPVTVETGDGPLHVYGAAYDPAESEDPLSALRRDPRPGIHVALLHAYVNGTRPSTPARNALTVDLETLGRLPVDYVALGDQHELTLPDRFGGVPACYPGSFAATDPSESGPRGYVLVDIEPGQPPRIEHRDAGVRPAVEAEIDVSTCTDDEAVTDAVTSVMPTEAVPVVRLTGEASFPLDADAVTAALVERFGHAVVADESRYYPPDRLEELSAADTVAGHVVRLGRERIALAGDVKDRDVAEHALRTALRSLGVR